MTRRELIKELRKRVDFQCPRGPWSERRVGYQRVKYIYCFDGSARRIADEIRAALADMNITSVEVEDKVYKEYNSWYKVYDEQAGWQVILKIPYNEFG